MLLPTCSFAGDSQAEVEKLMTLKERTSWSRGHTLGRTAKTGFRAVYCLLTEVQWTGVGLAETNQDAEGD